MQPSLLVKDPDFEYDIQNECTIDANLFRCTAIFSHQFSLWVQLQQQDLYVEGGPLGGGGGRGKGVHVEVEVEVDSRHLQWVVISIALLPVLPIDHQDLLLSS